jgi:hypothetical protein
MPKVKPATCREPGDSVSFRCPGCGEIHVVIVKGIVNPVWEFNGDFDNPTFSPSLLMRCGCKAPHHKHGDNCWCTWNAEHPDDPAPFSCYCCHSFVNNGMIQFLSDSTHHLAGQTVPLNEIIEGKL